MYFLFVSCPCQFQWLMQRMRRLLLRYRTPFRARAGFLNMMETVTCRQRILNGRIISAEQK
jgi:hypothetical protein